jgi:hypothetical protein
VTFADARKQLQPSTRPDVIVDTEDLAVTIGSDKADQTLRSPLCEAAP